LKRVHPEPLIILILLFSAVPLVPSDYLSVQRIDSSTYVSLWEFSEKKHLSTSFDLITGRGLVYSRQHRAVYMVGSHIALVDGRLVWSRAPVRRLKGEVFIPLDMADRIARSFMGKKIVATGRKASFESYAEREVDRRPVQGHEPITFIVIDAGHGGKDPGAVGKGGLKEKKIALEVSRRLAARLRSELKGIRVYMTRSNDKFLELSERTEIANGYLKEKQNGIFISVHVNASVSTVVSGFETYYLSQNPSNEEARKTAALENNVIILEDKPRGKKFGDIEYIEALMITTQIQKESTVLADEIQKGMDSKISRFKSRGVKKADFYVLRGVLMPAVLVEIGFISNSKESTYLQKGWYQEKVVQGITRGIQRFIRKYNSMIQ
jgi:N-acetylmuramoyl-L-alanine amidase